MKFGEKMRLLRKELNISQADAAEKIGVSRRAYIDWETKGVTPRKQDVYKQISEVFGVSIIWLTNDVLEYTPVSYDSMSIKLIEERLAYLETEKSKLKKLLKALKKKVPSKCQGPFLFFYSKWILSTTFLFLLERL